MKKITTLMLLASFMCFSQSTIQSFTLINADTDRSILRLVNGQQIALDQLPTANLNIRANVEGDVSSVFLSLSGPFSQSKTENLAPYALFGDQLGDYTGRDLPVGDYVLSGIPFSESDLTGAQGELLTINFSVVESVDRSFITTWKTDHPGLSEDNQITISTHPEAVYDYTVDWGDGTTDTQVAESITHTYSQAGVYTVSISGQFPRPYFGGALSEGETVDDAQKILSVDQWGDIQWGSMAYGFWNCSNLEVVAEDVPDLARVTSLEAMFYGCTSLTGNASFNDWEVSTVSQMQQLFAGTAFDQPLNSWFVFSLQNASGMFADNAAFNQNISNWNTANVSDMSEMFRGASAFDQNLAVWNIGSATTLASMFDGSGLSDENYDNALNGWSLLTSLQSGVALGAQEKQYCLGDEARQSLIANYGWTISDGGRAEACELMEQRPFITTWKTDNPGRSEDNQITIRTSEDAAYDYSIDWGDGTSDAGVTGDITHTYDEVGVYTISISGKFPRPRFGGSRSETLDDSRKIVSVDQWGDIQWTSMESAFASCTNLDVLAEDVPNLSLATSLFGMFFSCSSLIGNTSFNSWDTGTITNMQWVFASSTFNQPIGNWDMTNVLYTDSMFSNNELFNQDIGTWDTSRIMEMNQMFFYATSFDRDLASWDVGNVTTLGEAFVQAGLSDENYESTLIGWSQLPSLQYDVFLDAPSNQFCLAEEARQLLVDTYRWNIGDGGKAEDCINTENSITGFTLVDAMTNEDVIVLEDGLSLALEDLPATLNIRANTGNGVQSVYFVLSGAANDTRTENAAPYALYGDVAGNYSERSFSAGNYVLTAVPFTQTERGGLQGEGLTIAFSILSESVALEPSLSVYPNPTSDRMTLEFEEPAEIQGIVLYDLLGRPAPMVQNAAFGFANEATYDISQLPAGTYFLKVRDAAGNSYEKTIIKE